MQKTDSQIFWGSRYDYGVMVAYYHVYFVLCMIQYLLNIINPSNTFRNKINVLLEEYPNIDIVAMGFPENWKEQPLWKS